MPPGPGLGMPGLMGGPPTDIQVDANSGDVTIKKGPVNIHIARVQCPACLNKTAKKKKCPHCDGEGVVEDSKTAGPMDRIREFMGRGESEETGPEPDYYGRSDNEKTYDSTQPFAPGDTIEAIVDIPPNEPGEGVVEGIRKGDLGTVESISFSPGVYALFPNGDKVFRPNAEQFMPTAEQEALPGLEAKKAGHDIPTKKPWGEFNEGNPPDIKEGEPGRDDPFKDTWEIPYAAPANRRTPNTYDVVARVPDGGNARGLAYAVQLWTTLETEVDGNTVTIRGSENPVALINELKTEGIDATTTGLLDDYPKAGEAAREYMGYEPGIYSPGVKVAIVGDFPDMNYQYNPDYPAVEAQIVAKRGDEYLVRNDIWGAFVVEPHEIARANV